MTLTFDLLTLKVVSESHVTWATSVPVLVLLGHTILDLGPMYAIDVRQTYLKVKSAKCLSLLPVVLVLGIWHCLHHWQLYAVVVVVV